MDEAPAAGAEPGADPRMVDAGASPDKRMKLRYAGVCRVCGTDLPAKAEAIFERTTKTVRCVGCGPTAAGPVAAADSVVVVDDPPAGEVPDPGIAPEPATAGVAGSSARREYERRRANDEARLRQKWGKLGGIAVALSDEKQTTKAWAVGAVGEERLGTRLDGLASATIGVLHDRRIPRSKANIDHIVVTGAGIWVIDAKRYKGRPELKVEGGILRPRVEKLMVGRRDSTSVVDGVLKQMDLVRQVVGDVPITGVLCFVEADWPLIGGSFVTRGVHVLWPSRLGKLLVESAGEVIDVSAMREALAAHFTPA